MAIVFLGTDNKWAEISKTNIDNECIRVTTVDEFYNTNASLYLYFLPTIQAINFANLKAPAFINAVSSTLQKMNMPANVLRINAWDSFLQRPVWEVAGKITDEIKTQLTSIQKKIIEVPDEIGFASAKVVSMIINEAYFALEENVSTKNEIDIAMKLGTNYPYGPFEWANSIGVKNIYTLLSELSTTEKRYTPSLLLAQEAQL